MTGVDARTVARQGPLTADNPEKYPCEESVMAQIRVVVFGAAGRVGCEVGRAVTEDPATVLVGAVDIKTT